MRDAIGFYWTLPVPWAGFRALPDDAAEAAIVSRTIRYQRACVHRYAQKAGLRLVDERVFLELEPDRVSDQMGEALRALRADLLARGAVLIMVDFADTQGWRRNMHLAQLASAADVAVEILPADPLQDATGVFDPAEHFADWRVLHHEWKAGKAGRVAAAVTRARALIAGGTSLSTAAETLETEGLRSASGRPWTAESLRKAIRSG